MLSPRDVRLSSNALFQLFILTGIERFDTKQELRGPFFGVLVEH